MCDKFMILNIFGLCLLYADAKMVSKNIECGTLKDRTQIPWTVGIYLEQESENLELVCLGTILKEHYIITAAQCVCESLSREVRKEHIFVSTDIKKKIKKGPNTIRVKTKDVISRSDYEGFLLNPAADLAILKLEDSQKIGYPVCVDWADLNFLLEEGQSGLFPLWDNKLKTLDASYMSYDFCSLSTSEDFSSILGHDKNCFKVFASDVVPQSIGSGIYFKSPKDSKWYLEGVVSSKEVSKSEVFVAATSLRHYLPWLSRICNY